MAAGLIVPISGPYTATWGERILGTMDDSGFTLSGTWHGQNVDASDAYGMTLVEAVYRGLSWRVSFNALEFNQLGILAILHTFGSIDTTRLSPILDNVGDLYSNYAKTLVLTTVLNNPTTSPQTLTANVAVIAPDTNIPMLMTSKVREAPIEMVLIPYPMISISLAIPIPSPGKVGVPRIPEFEPGIRTGGGPGGGPGGGGPGREGIRIRTRTGDVVGGPGPGPEPVPVVLAIPKLGGVLPSAAAPPAPPPAIPIKKDIEVLSTPPTSTRGVAFTTT